MLLTPDDLPQSIAETLPEMHPIDDGLIRLIDGLPYDDSKVERPDMYGFGPLLYQAEPDRYLD